MIKIQEYNKEKQKISFISDMNLTLANAIRRSVLEIPIMAIDEIEIFKNDSALYDEIIAHRLGLVPVKTSASSKEEKYKLSVKGPKIVYSTDLEPSIGTNFNLPITILEKEQEIELVANVRLGKGIEHIKYSPGLLYYKHNIPEELLDFVYVNESGDITYSEDELKAAKASSSIIESLKKIKTINELMFNIESWGQIDAKEIFPKAIDALDKNLNDLDKSIK